MAAYALFLPVQLYIFGQQEKIVLGTITVVK
jgi:hypothetical protein